MELLIALKNNNHHAFNALYKLWHKRTYFYFLKHTRSENIAKDLTQQTFIKLWRYRETLSIEHSLESQIFQTARIIYIDELRDQARRGRMFIPSDETLLANVTDGNNDRIDFENREILMSALDKLPPMRRKVFVLHRLEGYSYKEIATHLSISTKTVDNHISQALKQLRTFKIFLAIIISLIIS